MAEHKDYFEEDERYAFDYESFLVECEYDAPMINILKRRLWNYYRYLEFKHVKRDKERAKNLKLRKNSRFLFGMSKLKVGEKIYDLAGVEGIKQFWIDCAEWRKDENNRDSLLGYDEDGDDDGWAVDQDTEKLEWMLHKEK